MLSIGRQHLGMGFLCACGRERAQSTSYRWVLSAGGLAVPALAQACASPLWSQRGLQGELGVGGVSRDSQLFAVMSV